MHKICTKCGIDKPLDDFYSAKKMADGHASWCKECSKEWVREYTDKNREKYRQQWRDRKTDPYQYLHRKYLAIRRRCNGKWNYHTEAQKRRIERYAEKGVHFTRGEWFEWCVKTYPTFISLYSEWQESGYELKLAPSIDRIDNTKGYYIDNIQWMTFSDNSRKGARQ